MKLIETILNELEPTIQKMVKFNVDHLETETGYKLSKFDKEYLRLSIIVDMVRSIEKYTEPTDNLVEIKSSGSVNGSLIINSFITRGDVNHSLYTTVIYAGGYNIQRLHYRYLTKTTLPQTRNDDETMKLKQKLQKMTKVQKMNEEIIGYETRIEKLKSEISENRKVTDVEIIEILKKGEDGYSLEWDLTWDEIVKRGADKNYDYDRVKFETTWTNYKLRSLNGWKETNITWKQTNINNIETSLKKLKTKISKL